MYIYICQTNLALECGIILRNPVRFLWASKLSYRLQLPSCRRVIIRWNAIDFRILAKSYCSILQILLPSVNLPIISSRYLCGVIPEMYVAKGDDEGHLTECKARELLWMLSLHSTIHSTTVYHQSLLFFNRFNTFHEVAGLASPKRQLIC